MLGYKNNKNDEPVFEKIFIKGFVVTHYDESSIKRIFLTIRLDDGARPSKQGQSWSIVICLGGTPLSKNNMKR